MLIRVDITENNTHIPFGDFADKVSKVEKYYIQCGHRLIKIS